MVQPRVFVTSDNHFGHFNSIRYCNRPFRSAEQMDSKMIANWNRVVSDIDVIYHLGDFAFKGGDQNGRHLGARDYVKHLRGTKILILGNHEKESNTAYMRMGFAGVLEEAVIKHCGVRLLLIHIPPLVIPSHVDYVLAGHIHQKQPSEIGNIQEPDRILNVCVEHHHYAPLLLETAVSRLRKVNGK